MIFMRRIPAPGGEAARTTRDFGARPNGIPAPGGEAARPTQVFHTKPNGVSAPGGEATRTILDLREKSKFT